LKGTLLKEITKEKLSKKTPTAMLKLHRNQNTLQENES